MKSVVTGASGFIGKHLVDLLHDMGEEVISLSRDDFAPGTFDMLCRKIEGADHIFNLAGANLNRRWTHEYKKEIYSSRLYITSKLVAAINRQSTPPALLVSTSAIGYYPSDGAYIETAEVSNPTFLGKLCRKWEREALQADPRVRVVITRLAPVLSNDGGIFPVIAKTFRYGLGGRIASGRQPFPWIMLSDLLRIYHFIMTHPEISGPVNCVAPDTPDNDMWTQILAGAMHKQAPWIIPAWMLRAVLGERSVLLTEGQHAIPYILEKNGFRFEYANLNDALVQLCEKKKSHQHILEF